MAVKNSYTFYPLPEQPEQFKSIFYMTYYDDDGNQTATHPYSHAIELETCVKETETGDKMMILFGRAIRHTHQAFMPPVDNHNSGLCFTISCRNRHKAFWDQTLWRTYFNSRQAKTLCENLDENPEISVTGDFRQVANAPTACLQVTVRNIRGTGHVIDTVRMEFPAAHYHQFFERIKS